MKPSLRMKLQRAITDHAVFYAELQDGYELKAAKLSKADLAALHEELDRREKTLDFLWAEAEPSMNPAEKLRYIGQILDPRKARVMQGKPPDLPEHVKEALDKVRGVFPDAREAGTPGARKDLMTKVEPVSSIFKYEEEITPIKRREDKETAPPSELPRKPVQGELL